MKLDSSDELLDMIRFEGSPEFHEKLRPPYRQTSSQAMEIMVNRQKWKYPAHRLLPRHHSSEKQAIIRTKTEALRKLGVIEELRATEWSQVHLVRKPIPNEWRFILDFVIVGLAYIKHPQSAGTYCKVVRSSSTSREIK